MCVFVCAYLLFIKHTCIYLIQCTFITLFKRLEIKKEEMIINWKKYTAIYYNIFINYNINVLNQCINRKYTYIENVINNNNNINNTHFLTKT